MGAFGDGRSGIAGAAVRAAHDLRTAEKLKRRRAVDPVDAFHKAREAERAQEDGARLLAAPQHLIGDANLELVPALGTHEPSVSNNRLHILSTLAEPTTISVDASEHRASAATKAGVLSAALDAAESVDARNSLEKMIAHQVAATHHAGMELLGRLAEDGQGSQRLPPVELARLVNAAARLFEVAQHGCVTVQRLKTGGKQTVVVQHVNVEQGGQAVVAGRLEGGRRRRGKVQK